MSEAPPSLTNVAPNVEQRVAELAKKVEQALPRMQELGQWPAWYDAQGVVERLPLPGQTDAYGFDAGVAVALDLIPAEKQKLATTLHANYSPEIVQQLVNETLDIAKLDPDSEAAWWLAGCSICEEGKVDQQKFLEQVEKFKGLAQDAQKRREAAVKEYEKMVSGFRLETIGGVEDVPYGEQDGSIQGAYAKGHKMGITHDLTGTKLFFIGTFMPTLGLEDFPWSTEVDEKGRSKSGPVHGSKQFVKCATREEMEKVVQWIAQHQPELLKPLEAK